jgi:hypothetical protein
MSQEIVEHRIIAFRDGIAHLAEQQMSRLGPKVDNDMDAHGKRMTYDQVGQTEMMEIVGRHSDTKYRDIPHTRRNVIPKAFQTADLVDEEDIDEVMTDPTNAYSTAMARAAGRNRDVQIRDAFFATAITGESGGDTEVFPAAFVISTAGGPTNDKILNAKEILDQAENDEMIPRHAAQGSNQFRKMLSGAGADINSDDYNVIKSLVRGNVDTWIGFIFTRYENLNKVTVDRHCPYWVETSMKLAVWRNPVGRVSVLPEKNYSSQVYYKEKLGATRMDATGVVNMHNDES